MAVDEPKQVIVEAIPQLIVPAIVQPIVILPRATDDLSCTDVFIKCKAPHYDQCEWFWGLVNCLIPGLGLEFCCVGYGCQWREHWDVFCAGVGMNFTAYLIYGWVVSIIVGVKMISIGIN
ncbi:Cysteine-rich_membrane protein 2 [Hexamita inflata]|uniref:Cysteine-rich membrane protein 2 n=1 Tax=Hexamita inflata TaxID=28002 RepID=A0AA86QXV0_9EUKA|nr:Cysteine-rich membrane protein 2 [Hexamita inflata]